MRNIDFHHIANTPPDGTEHYELSEVSEEEGDWFTRRIEVQGPECYYIGDESENKQDHESDELYQWYENSLERVQGGLGPPGGLEPLSQGGSEPLNVRMVQLDTKQHVVILDSGADVSLLPRRLSDAGVEVSTPTSLRLQDAQGGAMRVEGMRRAVLQFSSCSVTEDFVLSDTNNILLSLGRLLKNGWKFVSVGCKQRQGGETWGEETQAGELVSPDGKARVPVEYQRNSLRLTAEVRGVEQVRAVKVTLAYDFGKVPEKDWSLLPNGTPVHRHFGLEFVKPPTGTWKYRTTIVKVGNEWEVIEATELLERKSDLEDRIPGLLFRSEILTFLHRTPEYLDKCLVEEVAPEEAPKEEEKKMEEEPEWFGRERGAPEELQVPVPKGVVKQQGKAGGHQELELDMGSTIVVNGESLTATSEIEKLREGCRYLGLSVSGSKVKMFRRLCNYLTENRDEDAEEVADRLRKQRPKARTRPGVPEPTEAEIEEHMATHMPMQPWCDFCAAAKSKQDHTPQSSEAKYEDPGKPVIQMDFMYMGQSSVSLIILDSWTRFSWAIPVPGKAPTKKLAEKVVKFSLEMNYISEEVLFAIDVEPATTALLDLIVAIRQKLGYKAGKYPNKPYHKGRTARVERHIQNLRRQSLTMIEMVEDRIGEKIPEDHALRAWAIHHATWLFNRYHLHSGTQSTAFQLVYGRPYQGQILPFGEYVFGLAKPGGVKNRSLWTGGIWVGKDDRDMDVITSKDGIFTSRSARRTQPAWRARETLQLQGSPWTKKAPRLGHTAHAAPLPRIVEEPGKEKEGGENEPEPAGDEAGSDVESSKHDTISDLLLSSGQPTPRSSSTDSNQGGGQKRETEGEEREEPAKASKTADAEEPPTKQQKTAESSPTSADPGSPKGSLFPPLYAGQVEEQEDETGYHEDDLWEERVWKECEEEYEADSEGEEEDEDRPPKVSEEELERLDAEAGKAELDKLANMKVVKTIKKEECSEEGKFLTLRTVFDWRKRDGVWKRRCRIVCREFRAGAHGGDF